MGRDQRRLARLGPCLRGPLTSLLALIVSLLGEI